ncbi:MAG: DUF393 domain-containing protein [Nannocystaceae bacterium]
MDTLYVLYDAECGLCGRVRRFVERSPAYVPLAFIPLQHPRLDEFFPGVDKFRPEQEILVISASGAVYSGGSAWLMCLWALREYRSWSQRLATPTLLPLVRRFCTVVSEHRLSISRILGWSSDVNLIADLGAVPELRCERGGACRIEPRAAPAPASG